MPLTEEHQLKIQSLRARYQSADSKPFLDSLESELTTLLDDRANLELPAFKRFAERATKRVNELTALLLNDETLLNEQGKLVFQQRDLWRAVMGAFDAKSADEAVRALENVIDDKLNAP